MANPFAQGMSDLPGLRSGSRKGLDAIYKAMQRNLNSFNKSLIGLDLSTHKGINANQAQLGGRLTADKTQGIADVIAQAVASGGDVDETQRADLARIASGGIEGYQGLAKARGGIESTLQVGLRGIDRQYVKDLKASAVKEEQARRAELEDSLLGISAGLQSQNAMFGAQQQQLGMNQAAISGGGGSYTVGSASGLSAAEAFIIQRESGGNPNARNPSSGAFGIWQGNPSSGTLQNYARQFGFNPYTTDVNQQLMMFRAYVRERYGSAEAAAAFWKAHNWY
jgi:hypothetical protein